MLRVKFGGEPPENGNFSTPTAVMSRESHIMSLLVKPLFTTFILADMDSVKSISQ